MNASVRTGRGNRVDVHVANGLPGFTVIGASGQTCRDIRDRVRAAILSSGLPWPMRRITVDIPKVGPIDDLPIALGILAASGQISMDSISDYFGGWGGELALNGALRGAGVVTPFDDAPTLGRVVAFIRGDA